MRQKSRLMKNIINFYIVLLINAIYYECCAQDIKQYNVIQHRSVNQEFILPNSDINPIEDIENIQETNPSIQPVKKKMSAKPDERPLWKLLQAEKYDELQTEINKFIKKYKAWLPPIEISSILRDKEGEKLLKKAEKENDWYLIIDYSTKYPNLFLKNRVDNLWLLAEAYSNIKNEDKAIALYKDILSANDNAEIILATVYKAKETISSNRFYGLLVDLINQGYGINILNTLKTIKYNIDVENFLQASNEKKWIEAINLANKIQKDILDKKDVDIALMLAWIYYNQHEYKHALRWFELIISWQKNNEEAYRGAAFAAIGLKQLDLALKLLEHTNLADNKNASIQQEILYQIAQKAFNEGRYEDVIKTLQPIQVEQRAKLLLGWTLYRLNQNDRAIKIFDDIYRSDLNNEDAAKGLALGLVNRDDWESLRYFQQIAYDDKVQSIFTKALGEGYFLNRLYYAAIAETLELTTQPYEKLNGLLSPALSAGYLIRSKSGESGTSRLTIERLNLFSSIFWTEKNHEIGFTLSDLNLRSGKLSSKTLFGCPNVYSTEDLFFSPHVNYVGLWEPVVSYRHEDWITISGELGVTPLGGPLSSRPIGLMEATAKGRNIEFSFDLHARPLRESVLSYVGLKDPYSGKKWGRVSGYGMDYNFYHRLFDPLAVTISSTLEFLDGTNTKDNLHFALSMGLPVDLGIENFSYFTIGPSVQYEAYQHNANHFTFGYGGYFSPQSMLTAGLASQFFTKELERFLLKGNFNIGLQLKREEAEAFSIGCKTDMDEVYNSTSTSGLATSLEMLAAYKITNNWIGSAAFMIRNAISYDDIAIMVNLTYSFDGRNGLIQRDLKEHWWQKLF